MSSIESIAFQLISLQNEPSSEKNKAQLTALFEASVDNENFSLGFFQNIVELQRKISQGFDSATIKKAADLCLRNFSEEIISNYLGLEEWKSTSDGETDKACKKIIACFKEQQLILNLEELGLTSLPKGIFEHLTQLIRLECSKNFLKEIPSEIAYCKELAYFDCSFNMIENLPDTLAECSKLENLSCDFNYINSLPPHMERFKFEIQKKHLIECIKATSDDEALKELDISELDQEIALQNSLYEWLNLLIETPEFIHSHYGPHFATRILSLLKYAIENVEFRNLIKAHLKEVSSACEDYASLALNYFILHEQISKCPSRSLNSLKGIFKGHFALALIEEHAAVFMNDHPNADFIEVLLGFQTELKKKLHLPVVLNSLKFFRNSEIEKPDISYAEKKIQKSLRDPSKFAAYLCGQPIWVEKLKETYGDELQEVLHPVDEEMARLDQESWSVDNEYLTQADALKKRYEDEEKQWIERKTEQLLQGPKKRKRI